MLEPDVARGGWVAAARGTAAGVPPSPEHVAVVLVSIALAATHLLAGRLRVLAVIPRSKWLSLAGGVSVAYVFAHLLPEVARRNDEVVSEASPLSVENPVWIVALAGLAVFYAVEHVALLSRRRRRGAETEAPPAVFWVSIASFAAYNTVIGYLLRERAEAGAAALGLYAFAIGLHFVVNDIGLRDHHKARYDRVGRWIAAGAVVLGAVAALAVTVPKAAVAVAIALLSGGIVLNVLKEELPGERQASLGPFAVGLAGYTALVTLAG